MNDRELLKEFVRVERTESRVRILVREIRWDGPAEATSTWAVGQELHATATEAEANSVAASIIQDDRYFSDCHECGERNPLGWMHDERICQRCAVANHQIVY